MIQRLGASSLTGNRLTARNTTRYGRLYALVLLALLLPLLPSMAFAQMPLPADVRLVIDVSGSMKANDPNNLRQPAVELLVQLLPEGSQAGVWTFGKWVNMLVPHKPVSEAWRANALQQAQEINSVGLFTNIGEALEKASHDLDTPNSEYKTSIILLTDGMVDIEKSPEANKKEWRRIVDEVLPRLKASGVTIHTIALSDNADTNLMSKLSLGTGGMAEVALSADDLMRIFLKAFDAAAPAEKVPLADNRFVIDSSVEEFTALIFRKDPSQQTELIGPDQTVYSAALDNSEARWHRAPDYDLITVKQPLEGEWGVKAAMDPSSRVTVVSNLNLRVKPLPLNVYIGQEEELALFLQEDGAVITRPEFLRIMTIDAQMEAGNDEFDLKQFWQVALSDDTPPATGRYSTPLPAFDKDGIYQLNLVVDGKTFVRQFSHQFNVRQPFGAEVKQVIEDGKQQYVLVANSFTPNIDVPRTQVVATITTPKGRSRIRPLSATDVDTWKATLLPDVEGEYLVKVKAKGFNLDGTPFEYSLSDIRFNYSLDGGFVEEEEAFFEEPEATPEPTAAATPAATATPEVPAELQEDSSSSQGVPPWILYAALGVANLLIFALGFFLYRKFIADKSDDILDQFSDESIAEPEEGAAAATELNQEEPEVPEEEPPMEDLEPAMEDIEPAMEDIEIDIQEPEPEPDLDDIDLSEDLDDDLSQLVESEPESDLKASTDLAVDELDDLDLMEPDPAPDDEESDADAPETEDDEMVEAMLKAQGLDLAEDELDEAISNLIDDLDDDFDDDSKK